MINSKTDDYMIEIGTGAQAIEFAVEIEDHFEMREFLEDWMHGDVEGWSDYVIWLDKQSK